MATLGGVLYTTANKTVGTSTGGTFPFGAYLMTMSLSGTAETISWRQTYNNGASKAAIYTSDKSTLLGETNSQTTPTTGTRQGTIAVPFAVTASTQYWVVVTVNNDNDSFLSQTNNDGTDVFHGPVAGAGFASYAFPASFTSTGGGNFLGVPGLIVEGTASGGGPAANPDTRNFGPSGFVKTLLTM